MNLINKNINLKLTKMKNLNNIIEIAANLIVEGKANKENAIQMAIEIDNNRILNVVSDIKDMRDFPNPHNKNQKAYNIILNNVYNKLT